MKYALLTNGTDAVRNAVTTSLAQRFDDCGFTRTDSPDCLQFVLNPITPEHPRPYRRRSQSVFVISVVRISEPPDDLKAFCYRILIRSLSNLLVCVVCPPHASNLDQAEIYFTTPEAGFYGMEYEARATFERVFPIATAHYATQNELVNDLPEQFWNGTPRVEALRSYGRELDSLGLLPTPFPLKELLSDDDMRHLYRIFGMTGLSYGNLSVRERIPGFGAGSFWMTARGVDKSKLGAVGKDVLLVREFHFDEGSAVVSMPPDGYGKARVSVDAVEHAMIYGRYPDVGAIVHVHAWMDGIVSTRQNFPCGTRELAQEVCDMLDQTDNPSRTVVGLKNHGITVTGPSLEDIFRRLRKELRTEVPMYA